MSNFLIISAVISTSTTTALDWENDNTDYVITVLVKDNDGVAPCRTTYLYVPVTLRNVDEEPPTFTDPNAAASFKKSVNFDDDKPIGTLVTSVVADQTSDKYDSEIYSIHKITATTGGPATGNEFVIVTDFDSSGATLDYPTVGNLYLNELLDFTQKAEVYEVEIVATDNFAGSTRTMPTATVTVSVVDVNNNAPFFNPAHYHKSFPENTAINTPVVTVTATDYDATDTLTYTITSDPCNYFANTNNAIYFDTVPDYETNTYCTVQV